MLLLVAALLNSSVAPNELSNIVSCSTQRMAHHHYPGIKELRGAPSTSLALRCSFTAARLVGLSVLPHLSRGKSHTASLKVYLEPLESYHLRHATARESFTSDSSPRLFLGLLWDDLVFNQSNLCIPVNLVYTHLF
jgi:hypothetical protein